MIKFRVELEEGGLIPRFYALASRDFDRGRWVYYPIIIADVIRLAIRIKWWYWGFGRGISKRETELNAATWRGYDRAKVAYQMQLEERLADADLQYVQGWQDGYDKATSDLTGKHERSSD